MLLWTLASFMALGTRILIEIMECVSQLSLHNEKYNSCDRKLFVCYEA
jgi:hypothetical protein